MSTRNRSRKRERTKNERREHINRTVEKSLAETSEGQVDSVRSDIFDAGYEQRHQFDTPKKGPRYVEQVRGKTMVATEEGKKAFMKYAT